MSVLTIHSDADFDADFESNLGPSSSKSVEFVNKELSKTSMKNSSENLGKSIKYLSCITQQTLHAVFEKPGFILDG